MPAGQAERRAGCRTPFGCAGSPGLPSSASVKLLPFRQESGFQHDEIARHHVCHDLGVIQRGHAPAVSIDIAATQHRARPYASTAGIVRRHLSSPWQRLRHAPPVRSPITDEGMAASAERGPDICRCTRGNDASSSARSTHVPELDLTISLGRAQALRLWRIGRRRIDVLKSVFAHESGPDRLALACRRPRPDLP